MVSDSVFSGETVGQINDELWITESGIFTVPFTGWYQVWMIDGGHGGGNDGRTIWSGASGNFIEFLIKLIKGTDIPVTIGKGGTTSISAGKTYFGEYSTTSDTRFTYNIISVSQVNVIIGVAGGGPGGGSYWAETPHGKWYGAGGAAVYNSWDSTLKIGNGADGAVRLRFHNPTK